MHNKFMMAALQQAWLGRGLCAPNPSVGAVLVHNHQIIAADWHRGAGTAHAEQRVLSQLNEKYDDLVLYVTLEPCNHWGKTSPCVNAIIEAGIKNVIFAFKDPNPIVMANNTPHILQQHGIEVTHFPLDEIDLFYQSYKYWTRYKRPWVTAKIAQSLDGKIALAGGAPVQITNQICAEFTHQQRAFTDVILTSRATVNTDNPKLTARFASETRIKPLALLDSTCTLMPEAELFKTERTYHLYCNELSKPSFRQDDYIKTPCKNNRLDLEFILDDLGQQGYHDVWVEAGGRLFAELHRQQLVQRTYIYIAPTILGTEALAAYQNSFSMSSASSITWTPADDNVIACLDWPEVPCLPV